LTLSLAGAVVGQAPVTGCQLSEGAAERREVEDEFDLALQERGRKGKGGELG